jgi:hypothetical protein
MKKREAVPSCPDRSDPFSAIQIRAPRRDDDRADLRSRTPTGLELRGRLDFE